MPELIFKKKADIDELPDDITDLLQRNMLDQYLDRPTRDLGNGRYNVTDQVCFAEFLSLYYTDLKYKDCSSNDCQTVELDDALMESNHAETRFRNIIPLMSSMEKLK